MKKKRHTKLIHEGDYVAKVDVELIDADERVGGQVLNHKISDLRGSSIKKLILPGSIPQSVNPSISEGGIGIEGLRRETRTKFHDRFDFKVKVGGGAGIWPACGLQGPQH